MSPGDLECRAGMSHDARQHGIAEQRFGPGGLAGVDIGLAGVAGGMDDERRTRLPEMVQQEPELAVIDLAPAERGRGDAPVLELGGERLADIPAGAEQKNHSG